MSDMPAPCYRDRDNGVYFTRNAHRPECADTDCRGCRPCPSSDHCTQKRNCSWHVGEGQLTCGRCIAETRRDLRWIGPLASLLMPAALGDGVDSEAASLAGPVTDPEAWTWRKIAARANRHTGRAWHVSLIEDDDEHDPHRVTGTWARMLTEDYGHDMPERASLSWCVAYLDRTLHRVAHDDEQDFPLLSRELRKCRQHLEAVLHNDERPDAGAPCPTCRDDGTFVRLRREYAHYCDDEGCERLHFTDDGSDVWRCPKVREHWWTQQGYADMVAERKARTA